MDDFRIKTSWRTHWKRKKLKRLLGSDAVLAIVDLWNFAANNKTDGSLTGMTPDIIAEEVDWDGDPDALIGTLVDLRLLDLADGVYCIHDWEEHNPWVFGHEGRSEQARNAGIKSGEARRKKRDATNGNELTVERSVQISSTDFEKSRTPSPSPSPFPDPNKATRKVAIEVPARPSFQPEALTEPPSLAAESPPPDLDLVERGEIVRTAKAQGWSKFTESQLRQLTDLRPMCDEFRRACELAYTRRSSEGTNQPVNIGLVKHMLTAEIRTTPRPKSRDPPPKGDERKPKRVERKKPEPGPTDEDYAHGLRAVRDLVEQIGKAM